MKQNILVFPCGSEIGLDIYSSVEYATHFHLIGASSVEDHGRFVYEDYIGNLPFATEPTLIPRLKKIVSERHIAAIYPTMDSVITLLKEHESELGCIVIGSPLQTVQICLSKKRTYQALQNVVRTPVCFEPTSIPEDVFPVFAKPDVGYGGKGTMLLKNQAETDTFLKGKNDVLLLEYLPGDEFTVDCFTDKDGCLRYSAARKRSRIKDGISVNTSFVEDQSVFERMAQTINENLCFRGAWFYQVKRAQNNEFCLLEVASRLGGSSLLSRAIGVNFALLSLFDAFDYPVEILHNNYTVELDRALNSRYKTNLSFQSVYCDYDDCLVLDKTKVNTRLLAFLYQCLNKGKELILLTKHEGSDLVQELRHFHLNGLFDEVIHITGNENKADFILASKNPIFIDDSYSERKRVKEKCNIPVFSPDMIDVLM